MSGAGPTHHPVAALLSAAASGQLSPAVNRIIAAHARLCPHCAVIVARLESIAGAKLEEEQGVELAAGALERALAAVSTDRESSAAPDLGVLGPIPREVHDVIAPALGKNTWHFAAPGLRVLDLSLPDSAEGESFSLMRLEPGHGLPRHTHEGEEFIIVLTGAFKDELGVYRRGDFAVGDETLTHRPIAEPGEVCFALAVTTAPLKFKGPLGVLQRILRLGRS